MTSAEETSKVSADQAIARIRRAEQAASWRRALDDTHADPNVLDVDRGIALAGGSRANYLKALTAADERILTRLDGMETAYYFHDNHRQFLGMFHQTQPGAQKLEVYKNKRL